MHIKIHSMLKNKAFRSGYLLRLSFFLAALFPIVFFFSLWAHAAPLQFTDGGGNPVTIPAPPRRAVSLVPGVTEIIFRLKADQTLKGVTYHTTLPAEAAGKTVVGGFLNPCLSRIEALDPDIIFLSSLHRKVRERFAGRSIALVEPRAGSLDDIYRNIRLIGAIFDKKEAAERVVADIRAQVRLIARKAAKIPPEKRKRVIRLMGREQVMTPGDDSFQNAYIRAA
ncbi:MAG: ABC transporter substrate-binding protein, partial [Thermodesulfobacteriota bacterium]|nr:ABC transporter substrate-binding protein [Thermodesulfobacteriota bacterium]